MHGLPDDNLLPLRQPQLSTFLALLCVLCVFCLLCVLCVQPVTAESGEARAAAQPAPAPAVVADINAAAARALWVEDHLADVSGWGVGECGAGSGGVEFTGVSDVVGVGRTTVE